MREFIHILEISQSVLRIINFHRIWGERKEH